MRFAFANTRGISAVSRKAGYLEQRAELLGRVTSLLRDLAHGQRVDRRVPRNRDRPCAVAHHDVLALADDDKARFFQSAHGVLLPKARELGHRLKPSPL